MKLFSLCIAFLLLPFYGASQFGRDSGPSPEARKNAEFHSYFFSAIKEYHLGNFDLARKSLEKCEKINKEEASIYHLYGQMAEKDKDHKTWLEQSEKAFKMESDNFDYFQSYLGALEAQKEFEKALQVTEDFIKLTKPVARDYIELREKEAYLHLRSNNLAAAIQLYEGLMSEYGEQERFLTTLKRLYEYDSDLPAALGVLEKLNEQHPDNEEYLYDLVEKYVQLNEQEKAVEMLKTIIKNDGLGAPNANLLLAKYYYGQNQKELGIPYLRAACQSNSMDVPKAIGVIKKMGIPNKQMVPKEIEAMEVFAQSYASSSQANYLCGNVLSQNGLWAEASKYYSKAYEINENDYTLLSALMEAQYYGHAYEGLVESTNKAIETYPNQPLPYLYQGLALIQLKKYTDAEQMLSAGKSMVIGNDNLALQFELSLADCEHYLGNYAASDQRFDKLLNKDPNNATVLNNYAYFLALRNQKLGDAEKMSKKSLDLEPKNAVFMDTYGWILFKRGDYKNAAEWLKKAAAEAKDVAEIYHHCGDALAKAGNLGEAMVYWKQAQELGDTSDLLIRKISDNTYYEK